MGVTNFLTLPICDHNMDSVRNIRKVRCNDNAFACSGWHLHHVFFSSTEFVAVGIDQLRPSFTDWKQWKQRVAEGPRLDHLVQGFMGKLWNIV
jgi:hypothetical protein